MLTLIQTADKAFKDFFLEPAVVQLDERSGPWMAQLEKSTKEVTGKSIKMPLVYGRSGGIGNRAEGGDLPTPNPRKWTHASWETKNMYGRISISGKAIKASKNDKGAFADMLKTQMKDLLSDANNDFRRQSFGDGSGLLGTTTAVTTAGVVLTLDSVAYISVGKFVDILDDTDDTTYLATEREVISVDLVNKTITISGDNVTLAVGDRVYISGNKGLELTGIQAVMTPNTTLYGIDRSTEKWFNPNVETGVGALDELDMQRAVDNADEALNSTINFIVCNNGVARAYQQNQLSYKKNIEYMDVKGGYKTMSFGGVALAKDKYMPSGTMDFMNTSDWKLYRMDPWDWMDRDGAILSRTTGKDAYEATLYQYGDIGCSKPAGQSRLTGITEA